MGDIKLTKGILIAGIAGAFVIASAGASGALFALNSESNNNIQTNKTSVNTTTTENKLNGWHDDNGWYFYKNDKKQVEWLQDQNSWYYLGSDGKMRTGWIKNNDKWYYLSSNGKMVTNTTIDGCYLNENGIIEETPSNTVSQNNTSKNTETQNSLSKSDNSEIQRIVGKWETSFSICMAFLRQYNCDYIDITTTTFQKHPYKVVEEHDGYIDIKMQDSNIGYRISFDTNGSLHVIVLHDVTYTKKDLSDYTAGYIYRTNVCTFTRYQ